MTHESLSRRVALLECQMEGGGVVGVLLGSRCGSVSVEQVQRDRDRIAALLRQGHVVYVANFTRAPLRDGGPA